MRHWIKQATLALACPLALGLAANPAAAAPILVDFGTSHVPGGDWQSVSRSASFNTITLTDGTTLDFSTESRDSTSTVDPSSSALAGTLYEPAVRDIYWWQYGTGGAITLTIGNLDPNTAYTLEVISARVESGNFQNRGIFTLNGSPAEGMDPGEVFNADSDGWDAGDVLTWAGVTPNSAGDLTLSVTVPVNSNLFLNGLILVPEPASVGLLAAGSLCLIRRSRRP